MTPVRVSEQVLAHSVGAFSWRRTIESKKVDRYIVTIHGKSLAARPWTAQSSPEGSLVERAPTNVFSSWTRTAITRVTVSPCGWHWLASDYKQPPLNA